MSSLEKNKLKHEDDVLKDESKNQQAWHACTVDEIFEILNTKDTGLTEKEARKKLKKYGHNTFSEFSNTSNFTRIFDQFKNPMVIVLIVAFGITMSLSEFIDAGVILSALLIAVVVGVVQENKSSKAFKKLSNSQVKTAVVVRDGTRHEISASYLVPGDIVFTQNGMQVPADIRLFSAKKLSINEAALTGEWLPVYKNFEKLALKTPFNDRKNMIRMGTFVASGQGMGVVVSTGDNTVVGKLARDIQDIEDLETPLQSEMKKVSQIMLYVIGVLVIAIFSIGILHGQSVHSMLLMSIAIAVASIPEGLPAAVTIILAVGMESLLARGGLVRNLLAAETLGSTTYILTDKTGTLTEAKMVVKGLILCDGYNENKKSWGDAGYTRELFDVSLAATDAYVAEQADKEIILGNAEEVAIFKTARRLNLNVKGNSLRGRRIDYLPFESQYRLAAGLSKTQGELRLCINGAPEYLLQQATYVTTNSGITELDDKTRENFSKIIERETGVGNRLLAVSYVGVQYNDIPEKDTNSLLKNSVFAGVLVFTDPLREGIEEAIKGVQEAGARVLLITGDNSQTALYIARTVGIVGENAQALTGDELTNMSDVEVLDALEHVSVFARVLPRQKMRIAMILQQKGEIVAMTGDGINDAPALRRANIGISIGSGTDVAKEASDLVLTDDTFATIYAAIEEGRRIISNLRKIVGYLFATSLSEVALVGTAVIIGASVPILPSQILWANIIEEGLMSVAFAFEKGEKNAMKRKPEDIHEEGILSREMITFIAFSVTILSMLLLSLYFYLRSLEVPLTELRSAMFVAVSVDSLFLAYAFRSLTTPIWKIPLRTNIFFTISFLISTALLITVLTIPFFQYLLSYTPLTFFDIALITGFGLTMLLAIEVGKWLFFKNK